MKNIVTSLILLVSLTTINSCKLLKQKSLDKKVEISDIKNDVSIKKNTFDSIAEIQKHLNETSKTIASEEITIKNPVNNSIELTAKFKIDTSASLKGDTALKLVDINNDDVSITIYQNKKTNELMAKVKTGNGTKTTSFSEIRIKRNYSNITEKSDSSKTTVSISKKAIDSVDRTQKKTVSKTVRKEKKEEAKSDTWTYIFIAAGLCIFIIAYRVVKKYFANFLH